LAKEFSKDQSNSATGGDLGYFAQSDMVKEFSDAAYSLKANEYTKAPVKTQFGFHVIQALDKRDRPAPKLDDIKPQIEGQVKRDILNKLIETWRTNAKVESFDYDGKPIVKATEPAATPAPVEEKKAE
jgi:peptidyl-prolyl cis-trans isomerase C